MPQRSRAAARIERLAWTDVPLGDVEAPRASMRITLGLGSGLSVRAADSSLWAIADRGPNLKVPLAVDRYGLPLEPLRDREGAKIMPRPDIGPALCELRIDGDRINLVRTRKLRDAFGRAVSGLPPPGPEGDMEPAFGLDGEPLGADPSGVDTEAIAACSDGTFWIGDEYAPSLLKVDAEGRVLARFVPKGSPLRTSAARYPIRPALPRIAARRRLNRGFEALALSPDERTLFVLFQSGLDVKGPPARFCRVWACNADTAAVQAEYLYPFDDPKTFARDRDAGEASVADLKICDACALGESLLVLERISHTAKLYRVELAPEFAIHRRWLKSKTKPCLEEIEALHEHGVKPLQKRLIFTTDGTEIDRDLEGVTLIAPDTLLLVNDNDFGVEGAETAFWRVRFDSPIADV